MDIYSSHIRDSKYISIFIVSKKQFKIIIICPKCSILVQNNTKYENFQNSSKQYWANNLIFKYIKIIWMNILTGKKHLLLFSRANLFGYSFLIFLSCRIYSVIHLFNIYGNKYIWIFIHPKKLYLSHTVPNEIFFWKGMTCFKSYSNVKWRWS